MIANSVRKRYDSVHVEVADRPHWRWPVRPRSAGREIVLLFLGTDANVGPIHINGAFADTLNKR